MAAVNGKEKLPHFLFDTEVKLCESKEPSRAPTATRLLEDDQQPLI